MNEEIQLVSKEVDRPEKRPFYDRLVGERFAPILEALPPQHREEVRNLFDTIALDAYLVVMEESGIENPDALLPTFFENLYRPEWLDELKQQNIHLEDSLTEAFAAFANDIEATLKTPSVGINQETQPAEAA